MREPLIVKETASFDRELPPPGPTPAVCWKVFDVGMQASTQGNPRHRLLVYWEIDVRYTSGDYKGKRMLVSQEYTASLSQKGYLRRDLESWRSKPFTEQELQGFDIYTVEGKPCLLNIIHNPGKDSKVWANVQGVMKALPNTSFTLETDPNYIPVRVTNLLEKKVVAEAHTDEIAEKGWTAAPPAPSRAPTPAESDIF
jgi:hypothetical protein